MEQIKVERLLIQLKSIQIIGKSGYKSGSIPTVYAICEKLLMAQWSSNSHSVLLPCTLTFSECIFSNKVADLATEPYA